ncbi:MAG: hypothetical protein GWN84_01890 [Gammaproteobacteria bacterium]|nr:hypothetical protein [Gammaproteobacteria bacterium]NIR81911.1 hypothetical protein [Gammaproteobacteria bacterium]NIR88743.1 hypothetical protein [Gammaproteobacteria bacterium]NIU03019.1 hypothetical protein [Gammaproteobacteria bacterium]NIV50540.1 hypothetical protein [Gammaproteobacteria bacterium]
MDRRLPRVLSAGAFIALSGGILAWAPDTGSLYQLIREAGPIESVSAALWLAAAAVSLAAAVWGRAHRVDWALGAVILVLCAIRELDVQKWFTQWNLNNMESYWDRGIPLRERLAALLLLILPGAAIVAAFLIRMLGRFPAAWREGAAWTRDVLAWGAMLVLAAVFDKAHHFTPRLGIDSSYHYLFVLLEETLELTLAVYVSLALVPAWRAAFSGLGRRGCGALRSPVSDDSQ